MATLRPKNFESKLKKGLTSKIKSKYKKKRNYRNWSLYENQRNYCLTLLV